MATSITLATDRNLAAIVQDTAQWLRTHRGLRGWILVELGNGVPERFHAESPEGVCDLPPAEELARWDGESLKIFGTWDQALAAWRQMLGLFADSPYELEETDVLHIAYFSRLDDEPK
jgi:hypothetical protein